MITDEYEPEVRAKLKELLKPGMTFCDVGANLGVITLFAARLVGPEGRVFSFEPFPENAAVLRKNIELNRFANVTVVEQAVSDNNGEAVFQVSECCGCHTLGEKAAASAGEAIVVKTTRLDSIPGLTRMDVLKSDTEGMELGVLRGLGSLKPSAILIEANTFLFNVMGRPTPEHTGPGFLRAIRDLGYEIVENVEDPKAGTEKIESNYDGHCNLYIRPAGAGA
jgi:FkbM family methyltransferase